MSRPSSNSASDIETWFEKEADRHTSATDFLEWLMLDVSTGTKNLFIMRQLGWSDETIKEAFAQVRGGAQ